MNKEDVVHRCLDPKARPSYGVTTRATLRTLQLIFAILVAALYAVDLAHATETRSHASSEWIFAQVVACLSAVTAAVHCTLGQKRVVAAWSAWDFVLFVLWLAQTGVFGTIYTSKDVEPLYRERTTSLLRMRAAVWIDLLNMLLWLGTTVMGLVWCVRARKSSRCVKGCGGAGPVRGPEVENVMVDSSTRKQHETEALANYAEAVERLEAGEADSPPPPYCEKERLTQVENRGR
ncbi:hypothetical protein ASPACDRAFT_1856724 [Aspergillus aculeatus ATCC 16872]|uniref:MARVEL domain-containing protein n=1 Tax=Aspergillus aculeatus (strain ATCC 16872 / CBS 172.66 / WB 5094) TaxID=690307 RepID=A0A1L9WSF6_ASPA1|nr:uncharacterized protein ASPACDRAFT_1856724 [Aspergillus aculeatus ATCC 16872]OJJ99146.1 hypothetical protein ASPACDRAFT_1856724 [Aspergillus aculeatus ATCC 16872]